jgi:septal ring factor EnvC (AmiA/AmiB activator)
MSLRRRSLTLRSAALAGAAFAILATLVAVRPAAGADLNQLGSQLNSERARQQNLSTSVGQLSGLIASLDAQISLVQSREAAVRSELAHDRSVLATTQASLRRERARLALLRARLARARMLLSRQLVSSYEGDRPDLVAVVLEAHGFTDLLEKLDFLHRAQQQQQAIISVTKQMKAQADSAAQHLARLEASDRQLAQAAALRARALAGMNGLLLSKQGALAQARAAQAGALAASQARAGQLQSQISQIRAQQAAAARAAAAAAARAAATPAPSSSSSAPTASGPALGPSGGWAIPYAIVLCESGGQNLPPNSAGASGYYQILASTWKLYGGSGPAAYLASKSEQDAVASRIWNGGSGASQWVCAGIVGIH